MTSSGKTKADPVSLIFPVNNIIVCAYRQKALVHLPRLQAASNLLSLFRTIKTTHEWNTAF